MHSYFFATTRTSSNHLEAHFPSFPQLGRVHGTSLREVRRKLCRRLVSHLLRCRDEGQPFPEDPLFHAPEAQQRQYQKVMIDETRLEIHDSLEREGINLKKIERGVEDLR